jgi:two-component system KDP operon response regulator KdpE
MALPEPLALIVEDEPELQRFLRATLLANGYRCATTTSGEQALTDAAAKNPDIVLLDLGLPDIDGLEVTRRLREWSRTPIVVISARGQEADKVAALDGGADDYLTKPFGASELLARMRVALRHAARAGDDPGAVVETGDLKLDMPVRRVTVDGKEIRLTPIEYKLLSTLARSIGKVITHRQLLREVWGPPYMGQTHYLRVYMAQLRHKLEANPARPRYLLTEPSVGYRLREGLPKGGGEEPVVAPPETAPEG